MPTIITRAAGSLKSMGFAGSSAAFDYQISRSIRMNTAKNNVFTRSFGSDGNRRTWTWSGWVKRGKLGTADATTYGPMIWCSSDRVSGSAYLQFGTYNQTSAVDSLCFQEQAGGTYITATVAKFRDQSAWYHIVCAYDTTQSNESDRVVLYVNGVRQTTTTAGYTQYPPQNTQGYVNYSAFYHQVGGYGGSVATYQFDGYMADVNFIDGLALGPSAFAYTNATTGQWIPRAYTGTYGTNGFNLKFSDNSNTTAATLGADSSGNGNNFTPNAFSVAAGITNDSLVDTPTPYGIDTGAGGEVRGNYCTWNPNNITGYGGGIYRATQSDGNLVATYGSDFGWAYGSMEVPANSKTYFEYYINSFTQSANGWIGFGGDYGINFGTTVNGGVYVGDGSYNVANSPGFATGNTIGFAFDRVANALYMYKNGSLVYTLTGLSAYSITSATLIYPAVWCRQSGDSITLNAGQRPFTYTAPSGYKALCSTNLPAPTIGATAATQANTYFDTNIWQGNDASNDRFITNNVDLANGGGLIWTKGRDLAVSHFLVDSVRGYTNYFATNGTAAEDTYNFGVAGTTTGFKFANSSGSFNQSPYNYVGWTWKAGGTAVSNTAGSLTSQVSANTTSGFSIVTYTGNPASAQTVGHGLGVAPSMILVKGRAGGNWSVYHKDLGVDQYVFLNSDAAANTVTGYWGTAAPSSSVFGLIGGGYGNNSSTAVAYCFADVPGFSKFGSYGGFGTVLPGSFIHTGFRPKFIMIKNITSAGTQWFMWDTARNTYNIMTGSLWANSSGTEFNSSAELMNVFSNGFQATGNGTGNNASGATYIYAAFAEIPFKYSLAR